MRPTKIYVKSILSALKEFSLKGIAHITGGGFIENIPRMLPEGLGAELKEENWELPPVFKLMEKIGELDRTEMYNIFNMGTGMVIAVEEKDASAVIEHFNSIGEKAYTIGVVTISQAFKSI